MNETFAVLGLFDSADALMEAVPKVRALNLGRLEAYTPYPVHGLDRALDQRRSPLAGMVMVMGILGALTALLFQYWISAVDYPIITGGKAPSSWQAFVPIMFEVMVLFATFTAGLGMLLLLNRLPFFGHPVLQAKAIRSITRDRFALSVEAEETFDPAAARAALEAAGARDIELLPAPARGPWLTADFIQKSLAGIAAACLVSGVVMYAAIKLVPILPPMSHMSDQPRLDPQAESTFFKDGRGMRPPVAGTVARGFMPAGFATEDEAARLVNPLPRTPAVVAADLARPPLRARSCALVLSFTALLENVPASLRALGALVGPGGCLCASFLARESPAPEELARLSGLLPTSPPLAAGQDLVHVVGQGEPLAGKP